MKDETNQDLVNLLESDDERGTPVYVQLGLNPNYVQFHSPSVEGPIKAGYWKPSYAGVLTGYNFETPNNEYWEVYIRRHKYSDDVNYNYVRVGAVFEKNGEEVNPFAGITSMAFTVTVTEESKDQDLKDGVRLEMNPEDLKDITDYQSFVDAINKAVAISHGPEYTIVNITHLTIDLQVLEGIDTSNIIKDIFPALISLTIPDLSADFAMERFWDIWDVEELNFYSPEEGTGSRRLADERKTLTVKGAVKKLNYGANTFPNYDMVINGKRSDGH